VLNRGRALVLSRLAKDDYAFIRVRSAATPLLSPLRVAHSTLRSPYARRKDTSSGLKTCAHRRSKSTTRHHFSSLEKHKKAT